MVAHLWDFLAASERNSACSLSLQVSHKNQPGHVSSRCLLMKCCVRGDLLVEREGGKEGRGERERERERGRERERRWVVGGCETGWWFWGMLWSDVPVLRL